MLAILSAFSVLVGIASAFSLENRSLTRQQLESRCPEVYNLVVPNYKRPPGPRGLQFIGDSNYGCMYRLRLIVNGSTVTAVAKTPWAPNQPISEEEIRGLSTVDQYITDFRDDESGRSWVIMNLHLRLGAPLKDTRGWSQYVRHGVSQELCAEYITMVYEAYATEIKRVAETYKVHNHIDSNNVIFQEAWRGDRLVGMTARIITWISYKSFNWNSPEEISKGAAKLAEIDKKILYSIQPGPLCRTLVGVEGWNALLGL